MGYRNGCITMLNSQIEHEDRQKPGLRSEQLLLSDSAHCSVNEEMIGISTLLLLLVLEGETGKRLRIYYGKQIGV